MPDFSLIFPLTVATLLQILSLLVVAFTLLLQVGKVIVCQLASGFAFLKAWTTQGRIKMCAKATGEVTSQNKKKPEKKRLKKRKNDN